MEIILLCTVSILLLVLVTIVLRMRTSKLSPQDVRALTKLWQQIHKESDPRQQLLHADSLLDKTMKQVGYTEQGLGNKLKAHPERFSQINDVWWAHKLRNRIAHEITFMPTNKEHQRAMRIFQSALDDLGLSL